MSGVGGGGGAGSSSVPIPNNVRKTIQHIKEITTCHSEEEIYAMLKVCSMDPNETTQKLLFQDTFHEVKRRRDRKQKNPPKETPEPRLQLGPPGRGGRADRSNYLPHNFQSDAGDGRNYGIGNENGSISDAGATELVGENKETLAAASAAAVSPVNFSERGSTSAITTSHEGNGAVKIVLGVPSCHARPPSAVGIIKRQAGSNRPTSEPEPANKVIVSGAPEDGCSLNHEKVPIKFPEGEDSSSAQTDRQSSTSSQGLSSGSRPQSNYNSRSLHLVAPQKVTLNKEWKPKPSNQNVSLRSETIPNAINPAVQIQESSSIQVMEETKLQKKMEGLNFPQRPPVILPRHIHIPETEKINFSFGSFDASFSTRKLCKVDLEDDVKSTIITENSHGVEGAIEPPERFESVVVQDPIDEPQVNMQAQKHVTEVVVPSEVDSSSGTALEYRDIKQQDAFVSGSHRYSVIHTSPNYNFGIVPQIIGGQIASLENSDPQEQDISRLPSFVVPQPLDPASYYAQIYRSSLDGDGRLSPFQSAEIATKYNDYAAVLPQQSSLPSQEGGGNPLVLSTSGPTPLVSQAAGLVQSSIAMGQPPVPVFRPPAGVHISPYHQNYIPYGHYYPPIYVPPPTIPQYLPNGAFPQQPHGAGLFPAPLSTAAQGIRYPLPQYKTSMAGGMTNAAHAGMPMAYGQYDATPANYNNSSAGTAGNTTTAEELSVSKFRESNAYVGGQQNEGSRLWVANPGRDMTSLATTSFYNIPTAVFGGPELRY